MRLFNTTNLGRALLLCLGLAACKIDSGSTPPAAPAADTAWPGGHSGSISNPLEVPQSISDAAKVDESLDDKNKKDESDKGTPEDEEKTGREKDTPVNDNLASEKKDEDGPDKEADPDADEDKEVAAVIKPLLGCEKTSESDFKKLQADKEAGKELKEADLTKVGCYMNSEKELQLAAFDLVVGGDSAEANKEDEEFCKKHFELLKTEKGSWQADILRTMDRKKNTLDDKQLSQVRTELSEKELDHILRSSRECVELSFYPMASDGDPALLECEAKVGDEVKSTWRSIPKFLNKSHNMCWLQLEKSNKKQRDLDLRGAVVVGFDFSLDEKFPEFQKTRYGVFAHYYELESSKIKRPDVVQVGVIRINVEQTE